MSRNVGIIGVGEMGKWMALNLIKAGFNLTVHDIDKEAVKFLSSHGAEAVASPAKMARKAEVILFNLPNGTIVEDVVMGDNGIVNSAVDGLILVDCGTSDYLWTIDFAASLLRRGIHFVDAPVTGLESGAKNGTLTIMFGGDKSILENVRTVLEAIGSTIVYMGDTGKGQLSKMTNNLLYDINLAALAEVLPMAVKLGLDPEKIARVINNGSGRSFASEFFLPYILEGKFDTSYCLEKAYKDLTAAASISAQKNIPLPVAHAATTTYQMALASGLGKEDKGAMIKVFEKINNVQVRRRQEG